jgi:DNA-directed RNA polymerase III subunit RPC5
MTVKPTADGEEEATDTMPERIRAVQEEPWRKLKYVDEDNEEAWDVYNDSLFVDELETVPNLLSSKMPPEYLDTISASRAPAKLAKLNKLRKKA